MHKNKDMRRKASSQNHIKNPYQKQNPYHVKAKMLSSHKYSSVHESPSTNPQQFLYKRNYQQTPIVYHSNYIRQSGLNQKLNRLTKKLYSIDIKLDAQNKYHQSNFKQYLSNQYCPADAYLMAIKDKINLIGSTKTQFQRLMRMSNVAISKEIDRKDQWQYENKRNKENPFLRKNLIGSKVQEYQLDGKYLESSKYTTIPQKRYYSEYYKYDQFKQSNLSTQYYNYPRDGNQTTQTYLIRRESHSPRQSHQSRKSSPRGQNQSNFECSFGHKNGARMRNKLLNGILDAVIQKQVDDQHKYQANAKKSIKIKGKQFTNHRVQRLQD